MDVVLQAFDTFALDRLYANVLPLTPVQQAWSAVDSFVQQEPNATWSSIKESGASAYPITPASQYFSFEPSAYAYMSRWPRDNIYRQALSLFMMTW